MVPKQPCYEQQAAARGYLKAGTGGAQHKGDLDNDRGTQYLYHDSTGTGPLLCLPASGQKTLPSRYNNSSSPAGAVYHGILGSQ